MDLTTFAWVTAGADPAKGTPGCGGCHPGGGGMEFDRDGRRYDRRMADNPSLAASLDGDYFQSRWAETGVIEADCFLCHLPGYNNNARQEQLNKLNFQWAVVSGSGVGLVNGAVKAHQRPSVIYNKRLFNEDGQIVLDLNSSPASENCLFCHGRADMLKRGFSWNDRENHDVHNMHGIDCIRCHQGNLSHNLTKGDENLSTVRDDLDNTMLTCRECHTKGYIGAPLPVHTNIRPNHLEKLSCEACHIHRLHRAAAEGLDVSTGKVITYPKANARMLGAELVWKPDYLKREDGRLKPVNRFKANLYTNQDDDGIHHPLFAREIGAAFDRVKHQLTIRSRAAPLVTTPTRIRVMLGALAEVLDENRRFKQIRPAYHFDGKRFYLDAESRLAFEPDHTWVAEDSGFSISHNVAPTRMALGANGCADCHTQSAHIFGSLIASDGMSDTAMAHAQASGFRYDSLVAYLKELHEHNNLKWAVVPAAFVLVFLLAVLFSGITARSVSALSPILPTVRRWALMLLAFTGYLFFFNHISLLELIFRSMDTAVLFHMAGGGVLVLCSLPGLLNAIRRRRLEAALMLLLFLSGVMICCRERFEFGTRYGVAVLHAAGALAYLSLQAANWFGKIVGKELPADKALPRKGAVFGSEGS